jgi:hypothetical protein
LPAATHTLADGNRSPAPSVASMASHAATEAESSGTDCRPESRSPAASSTPTATAPPSHLATRSASLANTGAHSSSQRGSVNAMLSNTTNALLGPELSKPPSRHGGVRRVSLPVVHVEWETSSV